jgi:hypothetical protein
MCVIRRDRSATLAVKSATLRRVALDLDNADRPRTFDGVNVDGRGMPRPRL